MIYECNDERYAKGTLRVYERNFTDIADWLKTRENNTEEEKIVSGYFQKARIFAKIAIMLWIFNVVFSILFFIFYPVPSDYEGESAYYILGVYYMDRIIYREIVNEERGEIKFATPEEVGFSRSSLKHNDKIKVYMGEDGKILKSVNVSKRSFIIMLKRYLLASPVPFFGLLVLITRICLRTYFKPMVAWIDKVNAGELGYYFL